MCSDLAFPVADGCEKRHEVAAMMKTLLHVFGFMLCGSLAVALDITTQGGVTFFDCEIKGVDPASLWHRSNVPELRITHRSGIVGIPFDDLPKDLQKRYGWTQEKSAAAEAQKALIKRANEAHEKEEKEKADKEQGAAEARKALIKRANDALEKEKKEKAEAEKRELASWEKRAEDGDLKVQLYLGNQYFDRKEYGGCNKVVSQSRRTGRFRRPKLAWFHVL